MSGVKELSKHDVKIRRDNVNIHRDQGIAERFIRTLAWRLFGHKFAEEIKIFVK